jgi:glutamate-1-semialdehyde aminotransferase
MLRTKRSDTACCWLWVGVWVAVAGAREAMLTTELKLHLLSQGINVIKTFLLTLEHTEADIDHLIKAMIEALRRLREDGLL